MNVFWLFVVCIVYLCRRNISVFSPYPDEPFHNLRVWRSGDRRNLCSSGTSYDGFKSSKIVKGFVGISPKSLFFIKHAVILMNLFSSLVHNSNQKVLDELQNFCWEVLTSFDHHVSFFIGSAKLSKISLSTIFIFSKGFIWTDPCIEEYARFFCRLQQG